MIGRSACRAQELQIVGLEDCFVVLSLVYLLVGRAFALIVLRGRGEASKDVELLVLRHEVAVLRRRISRPRLAPADRVLLAAFGGLINEYERVARGS